jgi:hypothetical protein
VEDVLKQAQAANLDAQAVLSRQVQSDDPSALVAWAMETQAAEVARRFNAAYGEAFRYARFHPLIEMLLAGRE